jgi:hypothetical protein
MFMVEENAINVGVYATKVQQFSCLADIYVLSPMKNKHIYIFSSFLTTEMVLTSGNRMLPGLVLNDNDWTWAEPLPTPYTKGEFLKYIHWEIRKQALLLASRYKNGNFFHVLKFIAAFL